MRRLLTGLACAIVGVHIAAVFGEPPRDAAAATRPAKMIGHAISLTVADVNASAEFVKTHFGFTEKMAADGFVSLVRADTTLNLIFLQKGIEVLPPALRDRTADGVIIAFVVEDIAAEEARLQKAGVTITLPLKEEPWGEKLFQITDPNGIVYEVVEWVNQ